MASQRWRSSVLKVRTYPGADCGSDHQLLAMNFKLRLKQNVQRRPPIRFDLTSVNAHIQYSVEVSDRLAPPLGQESESRSPEELWSIMKQALLSAAKETVPRTRKRQKSWITNESWTKLMRDVPLKLQGLQTKNRDNVTVNAKR